MGKKKKRGGRVTASTRVVLARVLHEDDDLMTVEIIKNEQRQLRIEDGDRFFTMVFTDGIPWEK